MADRPPRPAEVVKRLFQRAQRVYVEVVRGLVEQKDVRAVRNSSPVEPVALAAESVADLLLLVGAREVEPGDSRPASSPRACPS